MLQNKSYRNPLMQRQQAKLLSKPPYCSGSIYVVKKHREKKNKRTLNRNSILGAYKNHT